MAVQRDSAVGPVAEFCAELKQLRISSGRDLPTLARQLHISRAQLYAILNGERKTPPDWDKLVRPLVEACTGHNPDAVAEWRYRHAVLVRLHEELNRRQQQPPPAADLAPAKPAPPTKPAEPAWPAAAVAEPPAAVPFVPERERAPQDLVVDRFARVVLREWTKEYNARKFNDTGYGLKVSWKAAEPALMYDWKRLVEQATREVGARPGARPGAWAGSARELRGSDHEVAAALDRVPTGWLVVLGEPGYGKSMLMLQLLIDLIRQRAPGDPVPVFVPMTAWDPDNDALEKWLEKQLANDYPGLDAAVSSAAGSRSWIADLLATRKIMPILDGLDEMPPVLQRRAVDRLNESFAGPDRPLRLVMTCRTTEYKAIVSEPWNPVNGAAAIELQPLDGAEVAQYLSRDGNDRRWDAVVSELSDPTVPSVLRDALATPLYACLASAIYNPPRHVRGQAPDPDELRTRFHDRESIQDRLLDEFIPSMYPDERKAEERRAREERRQAGLLPVERRLMFIASYLKARQSTTLEWWDLKGLAPAWLAAMVVGIVSGIAAGLAAALGKHVDIGVGFGTGLLTAEAVGLGIRHVRDHQDAAGPGQELTKKRRPGPGMAGGIIGAVLGGLGAGVAAKYHIGHETSLFGGVPEALGIAIGVGSTTDFLGGLVGTLIGAFIGGCLATVGLGLPAGIVNGLAVGIAAAVAVDYLARRKPSTGAPVWERQVGIPAGLIVGLVIGLMAWREVGVIGGIVVGLLIASASSVPLGMRYRDEELDATPSPGQAFARDASAFRLTALWAGLAAGSVGFIGGAASSISGVGAKPGLADFLRDGLGIGLSGGIAVGLCYGFYHAASPDFRILNWWLACQGKVPWRFRHFLDDAHQKTVLRQVGASYEFRHGILQDRLAARLEEIGNSEIPRP
jgi:NACHT domain